MNFLNIKWSSYELAQPEWLWLIPLFILINLILTRLKTHYIIKSDAARLADINNENKNVFHPLASLVTVTGQSEKRQSSLSKTIFQFLVFSLLILALTQPIRIGEKLPDPPQKRDIVFIVDTSVSMILRDYVLKGQRIDRMTLVKGVLDEFIRKLKGERMSIIVFGDHAYTLVPLTSDQFLLQKMLSHVQATMAGRFNAIGDGIALAVKQAANPGNSLSKRKRVLVLLTDADQPTGDISPETAAQLAKNENLPLYTIAIGATSRAAEEQRQGGLLYSPVDLNLVKKISSITGAKSFQAGDPNALNNAIEAINLHETNKQEIKPLYYREPLYHWCLIVAVILFSLSQLISLLKNAIFVRAKINKRHKI